MKVTFYLKYRSSSFKHEHREEHENYTMPLPVIGHDVQFENLEHWVHCVIAKVERIIHKPHNNEVEIFCVQPY